MLRPWMVAYNGWAPGSTIKRMSACSMFCYIGHRMITRTRSMSNNACLDPIASCLETQRTVKSILAFRWGSHSEILYKVDPRSHSQSWAKVKTYQCENSPKSDWPMASGCKLQFLGKLPNLVVKTFLVEICWNCPQVPLGFPGRPQLVIPATYSFVMSVTSRWAMTRLEQWRTGTASHGWYEICYF